MVASVFQQVCTRKTVALCAGPRKLARDLHSHTDMPSMVSVDCRGSSDTPWGNCVSCETGVSKSMKECDNTPPTKARQNDCMLPVPGDTVAIYDAVDTADLDSPSLGGALPDVETTFTFGDDPAMTLTGARQREKPIYTPKCRTTMDNNAFLGKCIEGVVVDSFAVATSMPSPEADARDVTYVVSEIYYKYPKKTATYIVGFQGCCRMGAPEDGEGAYYDLKNNANGAYFLRNEVSLTDSPLIMQTGTAASPFISHMPHITAVKGQPLEFKIHGFDAASRPLTYRLGDDDDHGVGLNQKAKMPYGNSMLATINEDSGIITFPASSSTSYENYYNLVVVVTAFGPCSNWISTGGMDDCFKPGMIPNTDKVTTIVDMLIRVVAAGFTGEWPQSRCDGPTSGLVPRSQECNRLPMISVPPSPQRFICNEQNHFQVSGTDNKIDVSNSQPKGIIAVRYRQRFFLSAAYPRGVCSDLTGLPFSCYEDLDCKLKGKGFCTQNPFSPTFPHADGVFAGGNRGLARSDNLTLSTAVATFSWTPMCERLEANRIYAYRGNHRLDVFGACFVTVDEGAALEQNGKLTSAPKCVDIAVLRCTKPTIELIGMSKPATNSTLSVWTIPVATNISLVLNGTDDTQSRHVTIYHTAELGVPVGAAWSDQQCHSVEGLSISCNPVTRRFFFGAELVHAGNVITICFEAVNDQAECPRYRPNNGDQPFGVHESPVSPPPAVPSSTPAIVVSQASGAPPPPLTL